MSFCSFLSAAFFTSTVEHFRGLRFPFRVEIFLKYCIADIQSRSLYLFSRHFHVIKKFQDIAGIECFAVCL